MAPPGPPYIRSCLKFHRQFGPNPKANIRDTLVCHYGDMFLSNIVYRGGRVRISLNSFPNSSFNLKQSGQESEHGERMQKYKEWPFQ